MCSYHWVFKALYIFWMHLLSDTWFTNIFSSPLIPLRMCFEEQKFVILIKSNLSFCSFMDHPFVVVAKKAFPNPMSQNFLLSFSYKFCSFSFMMRTGSHFELIFCQCLYQSPSTNCLKNYPLSADLTLNICGVVHKCVGLFLNFILFCWCICLFLSQYCTAFINVILWWLEIK